MEKISVEEHFCTEEYVDYLHSRKEYPRLETIENEHQKIERLWLSPVLYNVLTTDVKNKLLDVGDGRLREMDKAGIDIQVLSLVPGVELIDGSDGTVMAKKTNDELSKIVSKYPRRFAGFAALAPQHPDEAAVELERAVKELGLKGGKIFTHVREGYIDDKKYWGIFEKAEKLGVPIYIHPTVPSPDMITPFLTYPILAGPLWGYNMEAGLGVMRLIFSGVFDKYPGLRIILGHLGEALPFWLWRIENRWLKKEGTSPSTANKLRKTPGQYIKDNIFVTTSGMFGQEAFLCTYLALGAEKTLFAVDYPFESNEEAVQFMDLAPICDSDKEKIYNLNAGKLLAL